MFCRGFFSLTFSAGRPHSSISGVFTARLHQNNSAQTRYTRAGDYSAKESFIRPLRMFTAISSFSSLSNLSTSPHELRDGAKGVAPSVQMELLSAYSSIAGVHRHLKLIINLCKTHTQELDEEQARKFRRRVCVWDWPLFVYCCSPPPG